MNFSIIAVGQLKKGPEKDLINYYLKQTKPAIRIIEIDGRKNTHVDQWQTAILDHINSDQFNIFMDETGQSLSSRALTTALEKKSRTKSPHINFFIGGADGFNKDFLKHHADMALSLGKMTMPHMLARIVLVEQLYRVQKIMVNHPYHRD